MSLSLNSIIKKLMKKLVASICILFLINQTHAQQVWSDAIPSDPNLSYSYFSSFMYNNKVYEIGGGALGDTLTVSMYDNKAGFWTKKNSMSFFSGVTASDVKMKQVQNKIYILVSIGSGFLLYTYDLSNNDLQKDNDFYISQVISTIGFDFAVSSDQQKLFLTSNENADQFFYLYDFSQQTTTWNNSIASVSNTVFVSEAQNNFYAGIRYPNGNVFYEINSASPSLTFYNYNGSNDGLLRYSNNSIIMGDAFLVGNPSGKPNVLVYDVNNKSTYEKVLPNNGADFTINTSTDPMLPINIDPSNYVIVNNSDAAYIFSKYALAGNTGFSSAFALYKKKYSIGTWVKHVPTDVTSVTTVYNLSPDNASNHVAASYLTTVNKTVVSNSSINLNTFTTATGTCANHENIIFKSFKLDNEVEDGPVRFNYGTESTTTITNFKAKNLGYNNASPIATTTFEVSGFIQGAGVFDINLNFTDGYNTFTHTTNSISLGNTPVPNTNLIDPINLCSNDNSINLSNYVTNYSPGKFRIVNDELTGVNLNGVQAVTNYPNLGKIYYTTDVNGCIIKDSSNFYFPQLAYTSVFKTDAVCGANSGSASINMMPGSSVGYAYAWSTGETTSSINNLAPGPYYYDIVDDFNCHVRGAAYIGAIGVNLQSIITNVSCNGLNDGAISIILPNANNYQFLWSTGQSTQTISNLKAGTYTITVWDNTGCQITESYTITEPPVIQASFGTYNPSCGASNGDVYTSLIGGPYNCVWLGTGQNTPNLYSMPAGIYKLRVFDNFGCFNDFEVVLNDYNAALINGTVTPASCSTPNGSIDVNFDYNPNGSNLPSSWSWSNGATSQSINNVPVGTYTITAKSSYFGQVCKSFKKFTVGNKAPQAQPICLVTVDSTTITNLVVWEKVETHGIHHYNIYRESDAAGEFQLIDTVMAANEPIFNDVVASPEVRSWRYRISAVSDCGTEGPVSNAHKTLHLNAIENQINGTYNVYWDDYEGSPDVNGYVVWRFTDQAGWVQASPVVAPGVHVYTDTPPTGSTGLDYFVSMELLNECTAEKAQDFNTTRSNRERNHFSTGNGTGNSNNSVLENYLNAVGLYPNPTNNAFYIQQTESNLLTVRVLDLSGNVITEKTSSQNLVEVDAAKLTAGMYLVEISIDNTKVMRKLTKY